MAALSLTVLAALALLATALAAVIGPESPGSQKLEVREEVVTQNDLLLDDGTTDADVAFRSDNCGRVWVTVHSPELDQPHGSLLIDAVELNWDFTDCLRSPAQIGLFDSQPSSWSDALAMFPVRTKEGYTVTNISLGPATLTGGWQDGPGARGDHCLWPWVGAGTNAQISLHNCLKIRPTWMEDNAEQLKDLKIGELALPGTHNAGSWAFDSELNTAQRDRIVLCQDRSIWAQLVHGIRYFDFRVGFYDFYDTEDDKYWLNHNMIRVRPLVPLLREIRQFLDNTKEIVFLDAHHFPLGFYETDGAPIRSVHDGLLSIIQRELGPHLASYRDFGTNDVARGPTLDTLLQADKRLLFSYIDNSIGAGNDWLWPRLPHLWANTNNPEQLFRYLDNAIASAPAWTERSPMHSAMAQTTPTALDLILMRVSLRSSADVVNRQVTSRLRSTWRERANIISTDFYLGNDVTDVAIEITLERAAKL